MSKQTIVVSKDDITGTTRQGEDFPSFVVILAPAIELDDGKDKPTPAQTKAQKEATVRFELDMADVTYDALIALLQGNTTPMYELTRPTSSTKGKTRTRNGVASRARKWAKEQKSSNADVAKEWGDIGDNGKLPEDIMTAYVTAHPEDANAE